MTKVSATGRDDTLLAYDGMNRLTKTYSSGDNEEQTTTYDLLGRVSAMSTASGGSMSYTYDEWHRVASLTANGETATYTYDSYGNASTVTDPQSRVTTYHYDAAQRITKVSEPGGDILTAFDSYGNRTKITDSLNQDSPEGLPSRRGGCMVGKVLLILWYSSRMHGN